MLLLHVLQRASVCKPGRQRYANIDTRSTAPALLNHPVPNSQTRGQTQSRHIARHVKASRLRLVMEAYSASRLCTSALSPGEAVKSEDWSSNQERHGLISLTNQRNAFRLQADRFCIAVQCRVSRSCLTGRLKQQVVPLDHSAGVAIQRVD